MTVYLDHNASTPLHEDVLQAVLPLMQTMTGNASSPHPYGRLQKGTIERAREQVADLVNAHPDRVIFTSGKTEPGHVLRAMGVPDELALSSVRVSFGKDNTIADVEILLQALGEM